MTSAEEVPSARDRSPSTLGAIYDPLVHAAVQTRQDTDRITFQYIFTLTGVVTVLATGYLELSRLSTRIGASIVVLAILGVALQTVKQRARIYSLIYENLIRIETAMGAYESGRYLDGKTLLSSEWCDGQEVLARRQHWPHMLGLTAIAVITIFTVWSMNRFQPS